MDKNYLCLFCRKMEPFTLTNGKLHCTACGKAMTANGPDPMPALRRSIPPKAYGWCAKCSAESPFYEIIGRLVCAICGSALEPACDPPGILNAKQCIEQSFSRLREYDIYCEKPDLNNKQMFTRLFALHLVSEEFDLTCYENDLDLSTLIPEHHVYEALVAMANDHLVLIYDMGGTLIDEEDFEWHDLGDIKIVLKDEGRAIVKKSSIIVDDYIKKLKKEKAVADAQKILRIAESEKKQAEIQKEVNKLGGLVYFGLYHGSRRVRANKVIGSEEWILRDDEKDLIAAIGSSKISHSINRIDLRRKYGLREHPEIAPIRFEIDEFGELHVNRDDEWGQKALLYTDNRTFFQKLTDDWNPSTIAFLILLPHFAFLMWLSDNISSLASKTILTIAILALLPSTYIFMDVFNQSSTMMQICFSVAALYLFGPIYLFLLALWAKTARY